MYGIIERMVRRERNAADGPNDSSMRFGLPYGTPKDPFTRFFKLDIPSMTRLFSERALLTGLVVILTGATANTQPRITGGPFNTASYGARRSRREACS